ncbi:type IX secretion system outer membrane channel protein PorV [Dinghuibacter silviterrae]|uniref:Type IX secretion system protein PorV domain-containing protein n=1 Tax=Dinghuibacter silviterrae TaxID=1539049 RepID=A0A4R8DPK3_9BACT|nr:type IX secretion system outer membrane channel protein PorV [Dinghuibacter silviterrae]TDW99344.1 hypothetical protein EDB95_0353 [Dinghuibacter silviterrae]
MNQRINLKLIAASLISACTVSGVFAQNGGLPIVTTAVPMLRISADARSGGMGDANLAIAPDVNSIFTNQSKIPFMDKKGGLGLTYSPWLKDIGVTDVYLLSAAGYYKLDDNQALTSSIRYFNLGNIEFTDAYGNPQTSQNPREFAWDLGYARKLSDKMSLGIALRYINSKLATGDPNNSGVQYKAGTSVAGDITWYYNGVKENEGGWSFAAAITNLGNKISYTNDAQAKDYIPANLGIGAAYTKVFDEYNKITFDVDINKLLVPTPPSDFTDSTLIQYRSKNIVSSWFSSFGDAGGFSNELKLLQISGGAEYWYNSQFALRAGYYYEDKSQGDLQYFSLGIGLKYQAFGLNFSYLVPSGSGTTRNPLSNTLRFGVLFDLGHSESSSSSN